MILTTIEIFDFKSVKYEKIDINRNQLCFVGINESGKSSILNAISYLNVEKELSPALLNKSSSLFPNGLPTISCVFELSIGNSKSFVKFIEEFTSIETMEIQMGLADRFFLQFKRWGNGFNNISLDVSDFGGFSLDLLEHLKDPNIKNEFWDVFFSEHFPVIEYFEKEDLLLEPATLEELNSNDNRYETFRRLLHLGGTTDLDYLENADAGIFATRIRTVGKKINKIIKSHYKQDESIFLDIVPTPNGKLVVIITDSSDQSFRIEERSPGFQYYFAFLINKLYYNLIYSHRKVVFLLDEPGQSLHPKGAKDLLRTFSEIASKNFLFYTTHNPFLTIRNDIDGLIYVSKDAEKGTKINRKPWYKKYQVLRKELGILLNDSFLVGDINLLVEGITEKYVLHNLFQFDKYSHLEWLNIFNVDGVLNMPQSVNFLGKNNLNQSGVVLLDSDKEANDIRKKAAFVNVISEKNWAVVEINDVFKGDNSERTFEDLFPQQVYIDAFNDYSNSLKGLQVFDTEYVNFETKVELPTPIVNVLKKHFYSFITPERHKDASISKQDVMRFLFQTLEQGDSDNVEKSLAKLFQLAEVINKKVKSIEPYVSQA